MVTTASFMEGRNVDSHVDSAVALEVFGGSNCVQVVPLRQLHVVASSISPSAKRMAPYEPEGFEMDPGGAKTIAPSLIVWEDWKASLIEAAHNCRVARSTEHCCAKAVGKVRRGKSARSEDLIVREWRAVRGWPTTRMI